MSILITGKLQKSRLRINGDKVSKDQIKEKILDVIKQSKALTPTQIAQKLQLSREHISRNYLKELVQDNKIKKVEGSTKYQLFVDNYTKRVIQNELLSESEIANTELFKSWRQNNHSKDESDKMTAFARLCLGLVNPNFKMHPDEMNLENWEEIVLEAKKAVLETRGWRVLNWSWKQYLRHAVIYGLGQSISQAKGQALGIDGDKPKPKSSDLHITPEQIDEAKKILQNKKIDPIWFIKFGVKTWTFVRPSTLYIIKTDDVSFFDRTVEYVEVSGQRDYNEEVVKFAKMMINVNPDYKNTITLSSFTHRACTLNAFENKTQTDYRKFIYDVDFVVALEKYWKQRKFEKKKYLFWEKNETEFTFENYNTLAHTKVRHDNTFFKKILVDIGFKKEDFGFYFRANYGFRHFGLQIWLIATNYNYDKVSEMSHDDTATLKKWYGKPTKEFANKMFRNVVF